MNYYVSIKEHIGPVELKTSLSIGGFGQDINYDHPDISLRHCVISLENEILSIVDEGSEKGTFVNDIQLEAHQPLILRTDDSIRLGSLNLLIEAKSGEINSEKVIMESTLPDLPPSFEDFEDAPELPKDISDLKPVAEDIKVKSDDTSSEDFEFDLDNFTTVDHSSGRSLEHEVPSVDKEQTAGSFKVDKTAVMTEADLKNELADEDFSKTIKFNLQEDEKVEIQWGIPFFNRFLALIFDVLIVLLLTSFLTRSGMSKSYEVIVLAFSKLIDSFLLGSGIYISLFFLHFILYRLFSNLIFKMSLGKLLGRFIVEGKGPSAHGKAALRSLIGSLFLPFLFMDLPSFSSKPSMEENLTNSRFGLTSSKVSLVILTLGICIIFILNLFSPVWDVFEKIRIDTKTIKVVGSLPDKNLRDESRFYGFVKPRRGRIFLEYPSFETIRKEGKRLFFPETRVYFPQEKIYVSLKKFQKVNLKEIFKKSLKYNPLAFIHFSEILKYSSNKKFNGVKLESELKEYFKYSFDISSSNVFHYLFKQGPFFDGAVFFRKEFLKEVDNKITDIKFMNIGGLSFIRIVNKDGKLAKDNLHIESYLSLSTRADSFSLEFESENSMSEMQYTKFIRHYFTDIKWDKEIDNSLSQLDKFYIFDIIDYFNSQRAEGNIEEIHRSIFGFLYKFSKRLVRSKNTFLKNDFTEKLSSILNITIALNQKGSKKGQLDHLTTKINELMDAFKSSDLEFFGYKPKKVEQRVE